MRELVIKILNESGWQSTNTWDDKYEVFEKVGTTTKVYLGNRFIETENEPVAFDFVADYNVEEIKDFISEKKEIIIKL